MKRILLSTTSYQDTPGGHHELLRSQGYEIVCERGPLDEARMLELAGDLDGLLCGDDAITRPVLEKMLPRLKVISKYGIGLDKIDLDACNEFKLPVLFTPGVNHTTVAEHTFALLLASVRQLVESASAARNGEWLRMTGHEIWQKKLGIVGLGRIGREVAKRALAFDMEVHGYDIYWPDDFAEENGILRHDSADSLFGAVDIISLHANLSESTKDLVCERSLKLMRDGVRILNTSRGELVHTADMVAALDSGKVAAYCTDVLDVEPPPPDHPLLKHSRTIVTPHIGSRTYESVPRQAMRATLNLVNFFIGDDDILQANKF